MHNQSMTIDDLKTALLRSETNKDAIAWHDMNWHIQDIFEDKPNGNLMRVYEEMFLNPINMRPLGITALQIVGKMMN